MKFNALIPELSVLNIDISKKFYIDVLGFSLEYERIKDNFIFVTYDKAQIMIEQINGHWQTGAMQYPLGRGINLQITVPDVQLLQQRIISNGYKLFREIYDAQYNQNSQTHKAKEFLVQDPDGYLLRFSQWM